MKILLNFLQVTPLPDRHHIPKTTLRPLAIKARILRLLFFFASLLTLLTSIPVIGDAKDENIKTVYKVAIDQEYAPYELVDTDGAIKGFTPDLLLEIGKSAGVSFLLVPMDWPEAVFALENGGIDLINMIRTPQRLNRYEFSEPHSYIKQAVFRHVSAAGISDLESLSGYRVALQNNDISLEMLAARTDFKRVLVQEKAEGFLLLNSGKVDAFLAAEQAGLRFIREYGLTNVEPATVGLFPQGFCFAAREGNRELINLLNVGLKHLKESGKYDEIVDKWLSLRLSESNWLVHHWPKVAVFIGILAVFLAGFAVWNFMLRRAVESRTKALRESRNSLQESEMKYRSLTMSSNDAVVSAESTGNLVSWNNGARRIFGYSEEEARKMNIADLMPPEFREAHKKGIVRFLSTGESHVMGKTVELTALHKNGSVFPIELSLSTWQSEKGTFFAGIIRDITERKKTEKELAERVMLAELYGDIGNALTIPQDLQGILNACTDTLVRHLDVAFARIWTLNPSENCLELQASSGMYTHIDGSHSRIPVGEFKIGLIASERKPHITNAVIGDPRVNDQEWAKREGMVAFAGHPLIIEDKLVGVMGMFSRHQLTEVTLKALASVSHEIAIGIERKWAEMEGLSHLQFIECMDHVNHAIQETKDLEEMLSDVLAVVMKIYDCDRTWLFYPCDPDAPSFRVPMEITKPEYPGAKVLNVDIPMPPDMALNLAETLDAAGPVTYAVGTEKPINKVTAEQFGVKSMMMVALYPKLGKPWAFGMHQCSHVRVWTQEEQRIFQEISRRLADALTSFLSRRDLQESESKFRRIVDTASEGIWVLGLDTMTTFVNARMAEMLGFSVEEVIGRPMSDFIFEEDRADHLEKMERRRLGQSEHYERRFRRKDSQEVWTLASATPVFGDDHSFKGSFGMFTDITERKEAEMALKELNANLEKRVAEEVEKNRQMDQIMLKQSRHIEMAELLVNIAHQWRQPICSIGVIAQDVEDAYRCRELDETYLHESVGRIMSEVEDLSKTIKQFSTFFAREPEVVAFNIVSAVRKSLVMLENTLERQKISVDMNVLDECQTVGYPNEFSQAVYNIINNTTEICKERNIKDAKISVRIERNKANQKSRIELADNCGGVDEKILGKLFDPYSTTHEKSRGKGVGLFMSKTIIETNMHGSLLVENIPGGAKFIIEV